MCGIGRIKRTLVIDQAGAHLVGGSKPWSQGRFMDVGAERPRFLKNGELAAAALVFIARGLAEYNATNSESRLYQSTVEVTIDNQTEFRLARGWRAGLGLDGFRVRYTEPVEDEAVRDGGLGSPPVEGEDETGWGWNALPAV